MTRKSHKRAARYSELSRTRKKKQPIRRLPEQQAAPAQPKPKQEMATSSAEKRPAPKAQPNVQPRMSQTKGRVITSYQYVRDDLKRIGMLAGVMILVLIVLAFVLT